MPSLPAKIKILAMLAKNSLKQELNFFRSVLFHMETRVTLKYFVNGGLWKQFFASNSTQTSSNLISLTILVTLRPYTQF